MDIREISWSGKGHNYSKKDVDTIVEAVSNADPLTQGDNLIEFEKKFENFLGANHAFATANCTNALDLSAILSGLKKGDEVIIPSHTFCATAIPFARTGATIRWADIDPDTWVVCAETIKPLINSNTKVIIAVHLYGLMCDMPKIVELAEEHNLIVVEDCAQAIGADMAGQKAGTFGDFACFSFHGAKNISTLGEGGMLVVKSDALAELVPGLRHNGYHPYPLDRSAYWKPAMSDVDSDIDGVWPYNFCLGEIQCAVGTSLLDRIDQINSAREKRAILFRKALADFPELIFQRIPDGFCHAHHLLPAKYNGASYGHTNDDVIHIMFNKYKIKVIVQYYPLNRYPLFVKNGFGNAECPNTDDLFDNMVSFPFHSWMKDGDFEYMIEATRNTLTDLRI